MLKSEGPHETVAATGWSMLSCLINSGSAAIPARYFVDLYSASWLIGVSQNWESCKKGTNDNDGKSVGTLPEEPVAQGAPSQA